MKKSSSHNARHGKWALWLTGLGSLVWLLLRSGTNPRRLAYPCQRAALVASLGFVGHLASLAGALHLLRCLKRRGALTGAGLLVVALLLLPLLAGSTAPPTPALAQATLPAWTSPTAISDVFAVPDVPAPECSLDGGSLPASPPCNDPAYALHDAGVDSLLAEMEARGDYFYRTAAHPTGVVGAGDVVVIKINNQWAYNGSNHRLCTNTDALKGLIWRIFQHPNGFGGEVIVAENTQGVVWDWDVTPANSQDRNQSYQDVVDTFFNLGYPVFLYRWDDLNETYTSGGDVGGGYPAGEYIGGNGSDRYILLEDAAGVGTDELSYPKFHAGSHDISMRYGVWDGSSYHPDQLTLINMPVLKRHGMAGATIAWKNLIGFVLATGETADWRYGSWDTMHDFFWGYTGGADPTYGLLGRQMALVRAPDLNVVDAIWVADDNYDGTGFRQDILLASTDPFAVDWYASEYILYPLFGNQDASAARAGIFRNATRTNQNSAAAAWPGGSYPWIDLLDGYDGDVPSNAEHDQMNVYVTGVPTGCLPIEEVIVDGPTSGLVDVAYTFTGFIIPPNAGTPITYTWSPEPESGQGSPGAVYRWAEAGTYSLSLTVENCINSGTVTHTITIQAGDLWRIYLPLVARHSEAPASGRDRCSQYLPACPRANPSLFTESHRFSQILDGSEHQVKKVFQNSSRQTPDRVGSV